MADLNSSCVQPTTIHGRKPKRPPNAFFLYKAAVQSQIMEEMKLTNRAQVNQVASQMWAQMSLEARQPYILEAYRMRVEEYGKTKAHIPSKPAKKATKKAIAVEPVSSSHDLASDDIAQTAGAFETSLVQGNEETELYVDPMELERLITHAPLSLDDLNYCLLPATFEPAPIVDTSSPTKKKPKKPTKKSKKKAVPLTLNTNISNDPVDLLSATFRRLCNVELGSFSTGWTPSTATVIESLPDIYSLTQKEWTTYTLDNTWVLDNQLPGVQF
jgi:hypothetical protein